jgi:hypothetical protein
MDAPWVFYLNCGIAFAGVPRRDPDIGFPRAHAYSRCGVFVPDSKPQYELIPGCEAGVIDEITRVIGACSDYFSARHLALRELYQTKRWRMSFLADPELPGGR